MEKIIVNGNTYFISNKKDLQNLRDSHPADYDKIRTANENILQWALEMYMDALDAQDAKGSTGSYGKLSEVMDRVQYAIDHHQRIFLHDIKCRRQGQDDHKANGIRYERKTSFAQWEYGCSYEECITKLMKKAGAGIVMRWDPFKDERIIEMPLSDLLDYLAQYNPKKGLSVWFSFKPAKDQLQIQPVTNSEKRRKYIEALLEE